MFSISSVWILLWTVLLPFVPDLCQGAAYGDVTKIFEDKLGSSSGYMTTVRPLKDQGEKVKVTVSFYIVAIVEIDAITQKFIVNGFLGLEWNDELVAWDPSAYNNTWLIHPEPKQIWRPRLILANTVDGRDLFEDDYCPMTTVFDGNTTWNPGSLFPTSCKLNLYKYPFDEQECFVQMYSMGLSEDEIEYVADEIEANTFYFTKSGEWEVIGSSVVAYNHVENDLPHFKVGFKLRRLPGFFIVNIVIPIVLMSFLNIMVFLIPVDSGEKIGYGITVLLALTVFMSIVSEQLPRSSDTLPLVTIYLLVLTVNSVWTVIMAILIVYLHHRDEKETKHQTAKSGFKSVFRKFNLLNRATNNFNTVKVQPAPVETQLSNPKGNTTIDNNNTSSSDTSSDTAKLKHLNSSVLNLLNQRGNESKSRLGLNPSSDYAGEQFCGDSAYVNRWRQFGKHIDCICFITFTLIWISLTIGFLVEISS